MPPLHFSADVCGAESPRETQSIDHDHAATLTMQRPHPLHLHRISHSAGVTETFDSMELSSFHHPKATILRPSPNDDIVSTSLTVPGKIHHVKDSTDTAPSGCLTSGLQDFPTRPPLSPTVSFGGVSRYSYYTDFSDSLQRKAEAVIQEEEEEWQSERLVTWKIWVGIFTLCGFNFVHGVNATSLALILPTLANDLGLNAVQSFWLATAFLLSVALFQPLVLRCTTFASRFWLFILGLVVWSIGSIIAAQSSTYLLLLIGRICSGIGCSAIVALTPGLVKQMGGTSSPIRYGRIISFAFWLGTAIGILIGGIAVHLTGLRVIFRMDSAIVVLGALVIYMLRLPEKYGGSQGRAAKIDIVEWLLLSAVVISIILASSWAGFLCSWHSPQTLVPLITGVVGLFLCVLYARYRINSIISSSTLLNSHNLVASIATLLHGLLFTGLVFLLPIYFFVATDLSALSSALALSSWTLGLPITTLMAYFLPLHFDHNFLILVGWAFTTTTFGLLTLLDSSTSVYCIISLGIFTGASLGILSTNLQSAFQISTPSEDAQAHTTLLFSLFSSLGQALGVAVGSCVFLNQYRLRLMAQSDLTDFSTSAKDAISLLISVQDMSGADTQLHEKLQSVYVESLRSLWMAFCICSGLGFVLCLWLVVGKRRSSRT